MHVVVHEGEPAHVLCCMPPHEHVMEVSVAIIDTSSDAMSVYGHAMGAVSVVHVMIHV
jgi:hypothetical protein